MPTAYIMVGPPGVGKSTFINDVLRVPSISTDGYFETKATIDKITYSEAFVKYPFSEAKKALDEDLDWYCNNYLSFAWDQTQMSKGSRAKNISRIPPNYQIHCINFIVKDIDQWNRQLQSRPGKIIPEHVIQSMINSYEPPTIDEGFNKIWNIVV